MTMGRPNEALAEIGRAENLDSESSAIPADRALILFHAGKTGEAVRLLTQIEDEQPDFASPHRYLAVVWLAENQAPAYVRELKLAAKARHDTVDAAIADAAAEGLATGGRDAMFRDMLAAQRGFYNKREASAYSIAVTCAELRDTTQALSWLSTSVTHREPDNIALAIDPPFAGLHGDRRFAALLARAGLDSDRPQARPM